MPDIPKLKSEFVYLISDSSGAVKIGLAVNPESRRRILQCGSSLRLTLEWSTSGNLALETALHQEFSHFRTLGEWFDFRDGNAIQIVSSLAEKLKKEDISRFTHPNRVEKIVIPNPDGDEEGVFYGKEGAYYFKYFYEEF